MKTSKKVSLSSRIIRIIIVCWFIPILLTIGVMGYYMFSYHFQGKMEEQITQLGFDSQLCAERLNNIVVSAKKISYDGEVETAYQKYKKGEITDLEVKSTAYQYITNRYNHDAGIREAIIWFYDDPSLMSCYVYNQNVGGTYAAVKTYWNEDHEGIYESASSLDTKIGFYENNGRIYMIRNLMNRSYNPMGVLVLRLNPEYCFGNLMRKPLETSINIILNDTLFVLQGDQIELDSSAWENFSKNFEGYSWENRQLLLYEGMAESAYNMKIYVHYMDTDSLIPLFGYQIVILVMVILLIPLLYVCIRTIRKYISNPINAMIQGAEEIEKGNLGYQVEESADSKEFGYLIDTFNHMSATIKEQFNHIYEEEVALRDAKIMARQSHINPHFMNNTLEIINWEARMNGCDKVSKMIEALAVLMDASIDRKKEPEVTLEEEMRYVNAYLYIISERYGDGVHVITEFPEELMQYHVPRLILQPIIENAIKHGVDKKRNGTVILKAKRKGDFLYIDIINDLVEELDEKKISQLLDLNYNTSKETSGNMGIANVNQRLHILYGEPCGLQMFMLNSDKICARLTILLDKEHKKIQ